MTSSNGPDLAGVLQLLDAGDIPGALGLVDTLLDRASSDRQRFHLRLTRARLCVASSEPVNALDDIDAALALARTKQMRATALLTRGELRLMAESTAEAAQDLRDAASLSTDRLTRASARHLLGRIERDFGDLEQALKHLQYACRVFAEQPDGIDLYAEAAIDYAHAARLADDLMTAFVTLEQLLDDPRLPPAWRGLVLFQLGITETFLGSAAGALSRWDEALAATTEHLERARIHNSRAGVLLALGALGEARDAAEDSIGENDGRDPALMFDTLLVAGAIQRERGQPEASMQHLRRALEITQDTRLQGITRLQLGMTLAFSGLYGPAAEEFGAAAELCSDPSDRAEAFRWRGIARNEMGLPHLALEDFTRAVELTADPNDRARGELTRAALLVDAGRLEDAFAALDGAVAFARDPRVVVELQFQRGSLAVQRGNLDLALDDLSAAVDGFMLLGEPESQAKATLNLGAALSAAGRLEDAINAFQRCTSLASDERLLHSAWMNIGQLQIDSGEADSALAAFDRAAGVAADDRELRAAAFLARGNAALRFRRYQVADADFTRVLTLQPSDALQSQARYARGMTHSLLGQLEQAYHDLTGSVESARDRDHRAQALVDRGLVSLAAGDVERAERDLREASASFRRRSNRAAAHVHLATLFAQHGQCDVAAAELRRALSLGLDNTMREVATHDPRLRACWSHPEYPSELFGEH